MALKSRYDTIDDIPEVHRELFTERNGGFEFTGVEGLKSQADIDRLQTSLTKERDDHKKAKESLGGYRTLGELAEIQAKLDKYPELEAAAAGKIDDDKLNGIVEGRIKSKLAPVERERDGYKTRISELEQSLGVYEAKERQRTIHDSVRQAAVGAKVLDTAIEDALAMAERVFEVTEDGRVVTKEGVGVTPGIDAKVWLSEIQSKRPHWWPASQGGGAGGSGGNKGGFKNPFTAENWNMTEQGRLIRENPQLAQQFAASAGTTVGGMRPEARK